MEAFLGSVTFLFVVLNPFFLSVYLLDLIDEMDLKSFTRVLLRGALISTLVFIGVAWGGDWIFQQILHVRFAAFLIFGGIVFLLIGLMFVFQGPQSLNQLRGNPEHVAGSIAMPFMIGPGTISASILAGKDNGMLCSALAILLAVGGVVAVVIGLKFALDFVKKRNEKLVARYVEVMGRVMALVVGTLAIELILQGIERWWEGFSATM